MALWYVIDLKKTLKNPFKQNYKVTGFGYVLNTKQPNNYPLYNLNGI